jgi:hypothetical protein
MYNVSDIRITEKSLCGRCSESGETMKLRKKNIIQEGCNKLKRNIKRNIPLDSTEEYVVRGTFQAMLRYSESIIRRINVQPYVYILINKRLTIFVLTFSAYRSKIKSIKSIFVLWKKANIVSCIFLYFHGPTSPCS